MLMLHEDSVRTMSTMQQQCNVAKHYHRYNDNYTASHTFTGRYMPPLYAGVICHQSLIGGI